MSNPLIESKDGQDWLALQYVLGELTDAEREAFEQRLVEDTSLCEAVTEASRLVLTAQAALQPIVIPASGNDSSRSSWLAVVATSISVAALGLFALQIPTSTPRSTGLTHHDPEAAELVSLWQSGSDEAEADDADGDLAEGPGDVSVPGWMLAAVSLETDNPADKVQEN